MAEFHRHIEPLIQKEGGYRLTDIRADRGGQTYAGISRRSNPRWPGWDFVDRQETPPESMVHDLYRASYWTPIRGDEIAEERNAEVLFSSAVLSGPRTATILAQAALDVNTDGKFGPNTLMALNAEGADLFQARFALARIARFCEIVRRDPSQIKFLRGWINRVLGELE